MSEDQKAFLKTERGEVLPCLFNPTELSMSRSNTWSGQGAVGRPVPTQVFGGMGSGTMSLDLFFDTTDTGKAVTTYTDKLVALMDIAKDLPGTDEQSRVARPEWVQFHWGSIVSFPAVIETLNLSFVYFSSAGVPLRARVQLGLKQFKDAAAFGAQNPTSGTPRPHRTHRVQPGETLDRIAAQHYGDSTRWRLLAQANGIEDPLALRPGALISVPRVER